MRMIKSVYGCTGVLSLVLAAGVTVSAQEVPDVGPHPPQPLKPMESHIGNVTGHAKDAKMDFRRYCAGCHGDLGDANGENAQWIDPKPRDFTIATFKCRSTPTGTLPTDQDLYNSIERGFTNSNMPIWNTFSPQQRADLVAYIKTFSPRWDKGKGWRRPSRFPPSRRSPSKASPTAKRCSRSWNAGSVTVRKARATVRRRQRSPTAKISRFVPTTSLLAKTIPASSAVRPIRISTRSS